MGTDNNTIKWRLVGQFVVARAHIHKDYERLTRIKHFGKLVLLKV